MTAFGKDIWGEQDIPLKPKTRKGFKYKTNYKKGKPVTITLPPGKYHVTVGNDGELLIFKDE